MMNYENLHKLIDRYEENIYYLNNDECDEKFKDDADSVRIGKTLVEVVTSFYKCFIYSQSKARTKQSYSPSNSTATTSNSTKNLTKPQDIV